MRTVYSTYLWACINHRIRARTRARRARVQPSEMSTSDETRLERAGALKTLHVSAESDTSAEQERSRSLKPLGRPSMRSQRPATTAAARDRGGARLSRDIGHPSVRDRLAISVSSADKSDPPRCRVSREDRRDVRQLRPPCRGNISSAVDIGISQNFGVIIGGRWTGWTTSASVSRCHPGPKV